MSDTSFSTITITGNNNDVNYIYNSTSSTITADGLNSNTLDWENLDSAVVPGIVLNPKNFDWNLGTPVAATFSVNVDFNNALYKKHLGVTADLTSAQVKTNFFTNIPEVTVTGADDVLKTLTFDNSSNKFVVSAGNNVAVYFNGGKQQNRSKYNWSVDYKPNAGLDDVSRVSLLFGNYDADGKLWNESGLFYPPTGVLAGENRKHVGFDCNVNSVANVAPQVNDVSGLAFTKIYVFGDSLVDAGNTDYILRLHLLSDKLIHEKLLNWSDSRLANTLPFDINKMKNLLAGKLDVSKNQLNQQMLDRDIKVGDGLGYDMWNGRYSNGPSVPDYMADYLGLSRPKPSEIYTDASGGTNFAFSGARTVAGKDSVYYLNRNVSHEDSDATTSQLIPTMTQVDNFVPDQSVKNARNVVIISTGANDMFAFITALDDYGTATTQLFKVFAENSDTYASVDVMTTAFEKYEDAKNYAEGNYRLQQVLSDPSAAEIIDAWAGASYSGLSGETLDFSGSTPLTDSSDPLIIKLLADGSGADLYKAMRLAKQDIRKLVKYPSGGFLNYNAWDLADKHIKKESDALIKVYETDIHLVIAKLKEKLPSSVFFIPESQSFEGAANKIQPEIMSTAMASFLRIQALKLNSLMQKIGLEENVHILNIYDVTAKSHYSNEYLGFAKLQGVHINPTGLKKLSTHSVPDDLSVDGQDEYYRVDGVHPTKALANTMAIDGIRSILGKHLFTDLDVEFTEYGAATLSMATIFGFVQLTLTATAAWVANVVATDAGVLAAGGTVLAAGADLATDSTNTVFIDAATAASVALSTAITAATTAATTAAINDVVSPAISNFSGLYNLDLSGQIALTGIITTFGELADTTSDTGLLAGLVGWLTIGQNKDSVTQYPELSNILKMSEAGPYLAGTPVNVDHINVDYLPDPTLILTSKITGLLLTLFSFGTFPGKELFSSTDAFTKTFAHMGYDGSELDTFIANIQTVGDALSTATMKYPNITPASAATVFGLLKLQIGLLSDPAFRPFTAVFASITDYLEPNLKGRFVSDSDPSGNPPMAGQFLAGIDDIMSRMDKNWLPMTYMRELDDIALSDRLRPVGLSHTDVPENY